MGAVGTRKVFRDLKQQGHTPLELERGSMSFKIWKAIKIKRLRVPDIMCVGCGLRVESRAKTKLEITMSHSESDPDRGWDFGLNNNDCVALVLCKKVGDDPTDWEAFSPVQYMKVSDLHRAYKARKVHKEIPKGSQEGFETRLTWPSAVASSGGVISEIGRKRIKFKRSSDNRTITLSLSRRGIKIRPLLKQGDPVFAGQVIASVLPVSTAVRCSHDLNSTDYIDLLSSLSLTERYAAAKALSHFKGKRVTGALKKTVAEEKEHIYIRLEAAAGLMRSGEPEGVSFIEACLQDEYLENRLEAVIILGEIHSAESGRVLSRCLLDDDQHTEIRAGAAWSLGELGSKKALDALVHSFHEFDLSIRTEAARALAKLGRSYSKEVLKRLPDSAPEQRPGIAWAISKAGGFDVDDLLPSCVDEDARHWIAYILGSQDPEQYLDQVEAIKETDPEVYFAATVLWKIFTSWINGLKEY